MAPGLTWGFSVCRLFQKAQIVYDLKYGKFVQEGGQREGVLVPASDGAGGRQTEDGLERYLGSAADIEALLDTREEAVAPARTRHLGFGDVAAVWGVLERLDVVGVVDDVVGGRRSDAGASVGQYLALAALNRVVAPRSKLGFAHWWKTTAADRFTQVPASVLDHRRFWDAMHAIGLEQVAQIEHQLALAMTQTYGLDTSSLALDMTSFATYIDTGNDKAPIAQRGKAKQWGRADLRLVGAGLVVTRDGGVPLVSHAYLGNRPDVTQLATMIDLLCARHAALAADTGAPTPAEMTVVFDAAQNSVANFEHLADAALAYVGSIPPSDAPDLLALPADQRTLVDKHPTRRVVWSGPGGALVGLSRHGRRRGGQQSWCSGRSTWLKCVRFCGAGWPGRGCVRSRRGRGLTARLPAGTCRPLRRLG